MLKSIWEAYLMLQHLTDLIVNITVMANNVNICNRQTVHFAQYSLMISVWLLCLSPYWFCLCLILQVSSGVRLSFMVGKSFIFSLAIISNPLLASADMGFYPHTESQYHTRLKAKYGITMLSVDKFQYLQKQTRVANLSHAQMTFVTF